MIYRPMLYSGEMVRALLRDRDPKTQTRRLVKGVFQVDGNDCIRDVDGLPSRLDMAPENWDLCPYGQPGDRLLVRETFAMAREYDQLPPSSLVPVFDPTGALATPSILYRADVREKLNKWGRWRPSIHLPNWASRITLEIVSVRVERLQDISEADAMAEGCEKGMTAAQIIERTAGLPRLASYFSGYRNLWERINGPGSWDANPWIWAIAFKRVTP